MQSKAKLSWPRDPVEQYRMGPKQLPFCQITVISLSNYLRETYLPKNRMICWKFSQTTIVHIIAGETYQYQIGVPVVGRLNQVPLMPDNLITGECSESRLISVEGNGEQTYTYNWWETANHHNCL